jgi:hypothetical protein
VDGAGHGAGVEGVDNAEGGLEVAVCDTGLCALGDEVEDGGARCLRPGSCGCGDGDEGEEFGRDGETFAERGVDEVEEVRVWGVLAYCSACLSGEEESSPGNVVYKFISFAVSMTLPPPTARNASGFHGFANSIASLMLLSLGSTLTLS